MTLVQKLRELSKERLNAAAEEIFTELDKTVVQLEEEADRQRRLLDLIRKPQMSLHTTDLPLQRVHEERNSSLDQEDPEPPQMKEEKEELCISHEEEQMKEEKEELCISHEEEQMKEEKEELCNSHEEEQADMLVLCKSKCEEISREICGVLEKTLSQMDEEIHRQRRLLDIIWKPQILLHRIDLPQQYVCKEESGFTDHQLCNQEGNFSLDQEEPGSSQIIEEQEELCTRQHGEQIVLKQATDTFVLTSTDENSDHSELEPNSDQLLSYGSAVPESPHQEASKCVDSGPSENAALRPKNSNRKSSHRNNVDKSSLSENHCDSDTGRKSVKCDVCGNAFKNKYQRKKHHQIHKGVKPCACNACGKSFGFSSQLKLHIRTHTGEKPYSCKTCGKCFSKSSNLTVHMRTHTGEKL